MTRYTLPYDRLQGLPQRVRFTLDGTAYTAYLRRVKNSEDVIVQEEFYLHWLYATEQSPLFSDGPYTVIRIVRDRDAAEVLVTRLCEFAPVEARDPETYEVLMTLFPYHLTDDDCIIWVFT